MENISYAIHLLFIASALFSIWQFYKAAKKSMPALLTLSALAALQAVLSISGFYLRFNTIPPRMMLLLVPALLIIVILFLSKKGRLFLDSLKLQKLTLLHTVRIPVEIVLLGLFIGGLVPRAMTFEGYNFDIFSGITAPVIYYLFFIKKTANKKILLVWNIICLVLLINVVTIAILSMPAPFQQMSFDQPNTGVFYFPYAWLPGIVFPLVLLSHLAAIRQILLSLKKN